MFPTLTASQIARIAQSGVVRPIARGDVLIEAGDHIVPFFVVTRGEIEIVQPTPKGDNLVAVHGPGKFTGEANLILGRRSLMRAVASKPGEVIQLTREALLDLVFRLTVLHVADQDVQVVDLVALSAVGDDGDVLAATVPDDSAAGGI